MSLGIFSFDLNAWLDSLERYLESAAEPPTADQVAGADEGLQPAPSGVFNEAAIKEALESAVTSIIALPPDPGPDKATEKDAENAVGKAIPAPKPVAPPKPLLTPEARLEFERMMRTLQTQVIANYRDSDIADQDFGKRYVDDFPRREKFGDDDAVDARRREQRRDDERAERVRDEFRRPADHRA